MTDILDTLIPVPTVSGGENELREKIYRYIKKYTDEIHTDVLGNLIATRAAVPQKGKKPLKIAFFCAIDAPGRIVTYLEDNGLVRTSPIGKTDLKATAYTKVVKAGDSKCTGILVPGSFKLGKDDLSEPLFADFGFENAEKAARHIAVGDLLCFAEEPVRPSDKIVYAPALGNKLCAAALAKLAALTEPAAYELSFVFCAQSVLGSRGAAPAAFGISPDIAVCLEPYEESESLGVRMADRFSVGDSELTKALQNAAAQTGTTLTPSISSDSFTDAARVNGAGHGARIATLLYPVHAKGLPRERADLSLCKTLADVLIRLTQNL